MSAPAGPARSAHLVGSIAAAGAEEAVGAALRTVGPRLRSLPDGETGARSDWVLHVVEAMRANPDVELAREGSWGDYDDTPRFRMRRGRRLDPRALPLGYVEAFEQSKPVLDRLREEAGLTRLVPQVGIPSDLDLALIAFGPVHGWRHRRAFRSATVAQIRAIRERAGEDVVFQLEAPFELVMVARAPAPLRELVASRLARSMVRIAALSPEGTRFGAHLCLGDMNSRAIMAMDDAGPVVAFANAIARHWPAGRRLDYVHAPFSGASQPAPTDPAFMAPLADLRLGPDTQFVAGIAFDEQPLDEQRAILATIERAAGRPVAVSSACGLGRKDEAHARAVMERISALADSEE